MIWYIYNPYAVSRSEANQPPEKTGNGGNLFLQDRHALCTTAVIAMLPGRFTFDPGFA
ncbi:MAG: hypothetical protein IT279_13990 [Ignavibacteriaceae bacterium]|nr:hypothetical protein [Ignavibacteriaceae bacterium]